MQTFDVEDRWPELFAQLDEAQRDSVRQSLAAGWHEGFTPTRLRPRRNRLRRIPSAKSRCRPPGSWRGHHRPVT